MTMGIEKYKASRAQMAERRAKRDDGVQQMQEDLRRVAEWLQSDGWTKQWALLLNVAQSINNPASYRRLP